MPNAVKTAGHALKTWSAVCYIAPHLQFDEETRPYRAWTKGITQHQCSRRLSLTQAVRSKPIPTGLVLVMGMKVQSLDIFSQYSAFHL